MHSQVYNLNKVLSIAGDLPDDASAAGPVEFSCSVQGGVPGVYYVLVFKCTNDLLLLRFYGCTDSYLNDYLPPKQACKSPRGSRGGDAKKRPTGTAQVRLLSYFADAKKSFHSMALDDTARLLLCVGTKGDIYVVPIQHILFPSMKQSVAMGFMSGSGPPSLMRHLTLTNAGDVSQRSPYTIHDVLESETLVKNRREVWGQITCCAWWRSFEDVHSAILGTSGGFVLIFNLQSLTLQTCCRVSNSKGIMSPVRSVHILTNMACSSRQLLISANRNNCYILTLECEGYDEQSYQEVGAMHNIFRKKGPSRVKALLGDFDGDTRSGGSPQGFQEDVDMWLPRHLTHCSGNPSQLVVHHTQQKGSMVGIFSSHHQQLDVYDSAMDRFPLFQYQLGQNTSSVHCTDHVFFTVQTSNCNKMAKISVISKLLSATSAGSTPWIADHKADRSALIQELPLPRNQKFKGFLPGFQYNQSDSGNREENGECEVEGVLLWTETAIYEVRQVLHPEKAFSRLVARDMHTEALNLGKTFGLDLFWLYETTADHFFGQDPQFHAKAFHLYFQSNVSEIKLAKRYIASGHLQDAVEHITSMVYQPAQLSVGKRQLLANLLLILLLLKYATNEPSVPMEKIKHRGPFKRESIGKGNIDSEVIEDWLVGSGDMDMDDSTDGSDPILDSIDHRMESMLKNMHLSKLGEGTQTMQPKQKPIPEEKPLGSDSVWPDLVNFLTTNHDYNPIQALSLLLDRGLVLLALNVAHTHNIIPLCLSGMVKVGLVQLSQDCLGYLIRHKHCAHLLSVGNGTLMDSLDTNDQLEVMIQAASATSKGKRISKSDSKARSSSRSIFESMSSSIANTSDLCSYLQAQSSNALIESNTEINSRPFSQRVVALVGSCTSLPTLLKCIQIFDPTMHPKLYAGVDPSTPSAYHHSSPCDMRDGVELYILALLRYANLAMMERGLDPCNGGCKGKDAPHTDTNTQYTKKANDSGSRVRSQSVEVVGMDSEDKKETEADPAVPDASQAQQQLWYSLRQYFGLYREYVVIHRCISDGQLMAVAVIYECKNDLVEAFKYRLLHYEEMHQKSHNSSKLNKVVDDVSEIFRRHVSTYSLHPTMPTSPSARRTTHSMSSSFASTTSSGTNEPLVGIADRPGVDALQTLHTITVMILQFWVSHSLPVAPIEELFLAYIPKCLDLGLILCCLMFADRPNASNPLLLDFSASLYTELMQFFFDNLDLFVVDCWADAAHAEASRAIPIKQNLTQAAQQHEALCTQIEANWQQDLIKNSYVLSKHSEYAALLPADRPIVHFTCGHVYDRDTFFDVLQEIPRAFSLAGAGSGFTNVMRRDHLLPRISQQCPRCISHLVLAGL